MMQTFDPVGYTIGLLMLLCVAMFIMLVSIELMERRNKEIIAEKEEEIAVLKDQMTAAAIEREQLRQELGEFVGLPRKLLESGLSEEEVIDH
jgi:hypothetical protein